MIIMYSKPNCSYCSHAREFMKENDIKFVERKLDIDFTREFILEHYPTAKTYPLIIINDNYIGGFIDLKKMYETKYLEYGAWNGA